MNSEMWKCLKYIKIPKSLIYAPCSGISYITFPASYLTNLSRSLCLCCHFLAALFSWQLITWMPNILCNNDLQLLLKAANDQETRKQTKSKARTRKCDTKGLVCQRCEQRWKKKKHRCVQSVVSWTWACELGTGFCGGHICTQRCFLGNGVRICFCLDKYALFVFCHVALFVSLLLLVWQMSPVLVVF